jgi:hypothetical protein
VKPVVEEAGDGFVDIETAQAMAENQEAEIGPDIETTFFDQATQIIPPIPESLRGAS